MWGGDSSTSIEEMEQLLYTMGTTFEQVIDMALRMEEREYESRVGHGQQKKAKRVESTSGIAKERIPYSIPIPQQTEPGLGQCSDLLGDPQRYTFTQPSSMKLLRCDTCGKRHGGICRKKSIICYFCGQPGHYRRECPISTIPSANRVGTESSPRPEGNKGTSGCSSSSQ